MLSRQFKTFSSLLLRNPARWLGDKALSGLSRSSNNQCLLCGETHDNPLPLCTACKAELPWLNKRCRKCAIPSPNTIDMCGECLKNPPSFGRCWSALLYRNPVDRLIHQFKDGRQMLSGVLLSHLLEEYLRSSLDASDWPDAVTCVPLHWRRQLNRGFNQSAFIATTLASSLQLPYLSAGKRRQHTPKQQQLQRNLRLKNLRSAFVCDPQPVQGRHLAVVDDVVTSLATAEAFSKTLIKAGAKRVDIWSIARTPLPNT